jgi:hypothetical protein
MARELERISDVRILAKFDSHRVSTAHSPERPSQLPLAPNLPLAPQGAVCRGHRWICSRKLPGTILPKRRMKSVLSKYFARGWQAIENTGRRKSTSLAISSFHCVSRCRRLCLLHHHVSPSRPHITRKTARHLGNHNRCRAPCR